MLIIQRNAIKDSLQGEENMFDVSQNLLRVQQSIAFVVGFTFHEWFGLAREANCVWNSTYFYVRLIVRFIKIYFASTLKVEDCFHCFYEKLAIVEVDIHQTMINVQYEYVLRLVKFYIFILKFCQGWICLKLKLNIECML